MSQKRPPRRLLACAALSAGVLLGSGAAAAETPRPSPPSPSRAPLAALLDAALRMTSTTPTAPAADPVALQPRRRMGNTKGACMDERSTRAAVTRARSVPARRPAR